ncbi:MAG: thiamine phosphate synthase, partial [Candidatus Methylomirabilales bacterium]
MPRVEGEGLAPLDPRAWGLYVITDRQQTGGRSLEEVTTSALTGGARAFQLREKDLPARELCRLAELLLARTRPSGALLLINDRV